MSISLRSPVHDTLRNVDILFEIFEHLLDPAVEVPYDTGRRLGTLVIVARVCKTFSQVALDIIWRELDDLKVLLSVLPSFTVNSQQAISMPHPGVNHPVSQTISRYHFSGDIQPHELVRFREYARRVRILHHKHGEIDSQVFGQLSRLYDGAPLLPHIHELHWEQSYIGDELQLFVAPTARKIEITSQNIDDLLASSPKKFNISVEATFIKKLVDSVPLLQQLRIQIPISQHVLPPLSQLKFIRSLDLSCQICSATSLLTLHGLSNLGFLTYLGMNVDSLIPGDIPRKLCGFQILKNLHVYGQLNTIKKLLEALTLPHLHTLSVSDSDEYWHTQSTSAYSLKACMEVVRVRFGQSLRVIEIDRFLSDESNDQNQAPILQTVEPLLGLNRLEEVFISIKTKDPLLWIPYHNFTIMATAWPRLRRLHLTGETPARSAYSSLVILASLCRDLTMLGICVNIKNMLSMQPPQITSHGLEYLELEPFPASPAECNKLALLLDQAFPMLDINWCLQFAEPGTPTTILSHMQILQTTRSHATLRRV